MICAEPQPWSTRMLPTMSGIRVPWYRPSNASLSLMKPLRRPVSSSSEMLAEKPLPNAKV